jgi:hypothetical protein
LQIFLAISLTSILPGHTASTQQLASHGLNGSGCESGEPRIGSTLLKLALARCHLRLRMLKSGETAPMHEIAQRNGADHSYVAKHFNLTLLAPDIVAAILDEALQGGVRLHALSINPPALWEDQRPALG